MLKDREKLCFACPASYPAGYSSCPRCQLPLVFPSIGRVWVVEGLLGRGGMGAVFAAHHMSDPKRKAAVKVLVPVPGEQLADRRDRIGRFHREALALRRLVHNNIVQLYDFARERDGSLYLAMERLVGPTLSTLLKQQGLLGISRAVELILPVLSAVGAAHKVGVIHRDLKPDNIVLAEIGGGDARRHEIKVVDFGVARLAGDTFTRTGQALGTPVYMPPEQANGTDIDERVDIYGAGAVLYELLTGHPPFVAPEGPNANLAVLAMVMTSEPRRPRDLRPEISPALESVVLRALRRNREERFATVAAFTAAVREAVQHPDRVAWTPPAEAPRAPAPLPLLPSLAADSLPGVGSPGPQPKGAAPRKAGPTGTEVAPAFPGAIRASSSFDTASLGVKVLVASLYLVLVGAISVSFLLDRVTWRPGAPRRPGSSSQPPSLSAVGAAERGAVTPAGGCPAGMVPVAPGCFTMGSADPAADPDEKPPHEVCLVHAYCIDQTEVDNASYQACVRRGACPPPGQDFRRLRREDFVAERQPVVMVSWKAASTYCRFAGKRLPTEAEWEYAARGSSGWLYPWGDGPPTCESAVVGAYALGCDDSSPWCKAASECVGKNPPHPMAPGSRPQDRSPFGVLDMAGNVSEWVGDWYDERYYQLSPREDPTGPADGKERVYRGGSWGQMGSYVRATFRNHMDPAYPGDIGVGFRCVR